MSQEKNRTVQFIIITVMILLAALSRLLPHPPNFTPLGGMALFGAAYFNRKALALIVPIVALWISSFILDNIVYAEFYEGIVWFSNIGVYIAFIAIVGFGWFILKKVNLNNLVLGSLGASIIFFIISNLGSWLAGTMYPLTFAGLVECFTLAIPFFANTVMGDLVYVGVLFGGYALLTRRFPQLAIA